MLSWCFWKRVVEYFVRLRPGDMLSWCFWKRVVEYLVRLRRGDMLSWCFWKRVVEYLVRLRPGDMLSWCFWKRVVQYFVRLRRGDMLSWCFWKRVVQYLVRLRPGDMLNWCFWKRVVQYLVRLRPGDMKRQCSIFGASPVLTEWATHPDGGVSVTFSSPLANPVYLPTPESKLLSVTTLSLLFLLLSFNSALLLSKLCAPGTPSKTADISTDLSLHTCVPAYPDVNRSWICVYAAVVW
jgi:hypothetical protein